MGDDRFYRLARAAGAVAVLVGSTVFLAWVFDLALLKSVLPGGVTMKANAAISFVLVGASLILQSEPSPTPRGRWIGRVCALLAVAVGGLTLAEYALGVDVGIDQLLFRAPAGELGTSGPGRMAPNTALSLVLAGTALALLDTRRRALRSTSQVLAIALLRSGVVARAGSALSVTALYRVAGYTSMAIQASLGFVVLSIGILASRPRRGVVAILMQDNQTGVAVRRLLPLIVVIPLVVGWVVLKGQKAGLYGTEFGLALMVTVNVSIIASLALWNAHVQGASETARQHVLRDEQFLLELGELLRVSNESSEVLFQVSKSLGEYLGVSRCLFIEIDITHDRAKFRRDDRAKVHRDYHVGLTSLSGMITLSSYGPASLAEAMAGRTVVSYDTSTDVQTAEQYEKAYRPEGIRARVVVPLLRNGQCVSTLLVSTHEPREWQAREVALIQSVAERTWLWFEHLQVTKALRQRKRDLKESAEQFRLAIEAAPTGMLMIDRAGKIVLLNAQLEKLFGYSREELIGESMEVLVPGRLRDQHPRHRAAFYHDPKSRPMTAGRELYGLRKDGTEVPIEIGLSPLRTSEGEFVLSSVVDITERKRGEREREDLMDQLRTLNAELEERVRVRTGELSVSLEERETLLQEIHHRVKNNLQVISSLINMQVRKIDDRASRNALKECQARVQAIGLIHEKLYQSRDYAHIPFSEYARSLAGNIFYAAEVSPSSVALQIDVEPVSLTVDKAIPCGLILNELMTNTLKHAFPAERRGTIRVELRKLDAQVILGVRDDGVGMPPGFDLSKSKTLGMQLVNTLVLQLDGQLEITRDGGTALKITFPVEKKS